MGKDSKIGWCNHTFNFVHGCTKIGVDCKNCYAEAQSNRYGHDVWGPNNPRKAVSDARWKEVLKWNAAAEKAGEMARVFCGSMMDFAEDAMPVVDWQGNPMSHETCGITGILTTNHLRARLWKLIDATPWLDWLLLTKRPENINSMIPAEWWENPPRNVMFGMSAGNQETFDERFPAFQKVKGRKFLSLEPLIGPININHARIRLVDRMLVDWVIVGGESGPKARPCSIEDIQEIVLACFASKTPVYVKQLGSKPSVDGKPFVTSVLGQHRDKGENWDHWPSELDALKVREFPEIGAGLSHLL